MRNRTGAVTFGAGKLRTASVNASMMATGQLVFRKYAAAFMSKKGTLKNLERWVSRSTSKVGAGQDDIRVDVRKDIDYGKPTVVVGAPSLRHRTGNLGLQSCSSQAKWVSDGAGIEAPAC